VAARTNQVVMTSTFAHFVGAQTPVAGGPLPLAHTTDAWGFRSLLQQPVLRATLCPIYKQNLLYLFYAKPAYRLHGSIEPTTLPAYSLVSFILAPVPILQPLRIMPFDSGAMSAGLFGKILHPGMQLDHFDLGPLLDNADRLIGFFFGTARAYYTGRSKEIASIPPLQLEALHYFSLIKSDVPLPFDERRGTIEVQFENVIDLTKQKVLAVALPGSFMDDPIVEHFVTKTLNAEPLEYTTYHAEPKENTRAILDLTLEFYSRRGIL
jgi:hypothetical protein